MLVEVHYKDGGTERRLVPPAETLVCFVQTCESQRGSKIRTIKVVKRNDHPHRTDERR
jgi:hypothetical protein